MKQTENQKLKFVNSCYLYAITLVDAQKNSLSKAQFMHGEKFEPVLSNLLILIDK
jgi:hypothetical protein